VAQHADVHRGRGAAMLAARRPVTMPPARAFSPRASALRASRAMASCAHDRHDFRGGAVDAALPLVRGAYFQLVWKEPPPAGRKPPASL